MTKPVKILIVEDEVIIGANISLQLTSLGHEVSGIVPRGEEALVHIHQNKPRFYETEGRLCIFLLKLDTADLFLNKALAGYENIQYRKGEANTFMRLALLNKIRVELDEALQNDLAALTIMDTAVPQGLIVNELLTSTLKYAFP